MGGDEQRPRAARMFSAVQGLEARLGRRVTLDELGEMVARAEGRAEPYAGSVVRRWLKDLSEPRTTATWVALAGVLGVEPGYLAFGHTTDAATTPRTDYPPSVPQTLAEHPAAQPPSGAERAIAKQQAADAKNPAKRRRGGGKQA